MVSISLSLYVAVVVSIYSALTGPPPQVPLPACDLLLWHVRGTIHKKYTTPAHLLLNSAISLLSD